MTSPVYIVLIHFMHKMDISVFLQSSIVFPVHTFVLQHCLTIAPSHVWVQEVRNLNHLPQAMQTILDDHILFLTFIK
jgi:hypothetical protein